MTWKSPHFNFNFSILKNCCRYLISILILVFILFCFSDLLAAEIKIYPATKNESLPLIEIEGEIKSDDYDKFVYISSNYDSAIVLLNSEGGMLRPALNIGKYINSRGYSTAVLDSSVCASACALIWLSGSKRFVIGNGEIGFHASYLENDGKKIETGVGNALVGHYIAQLGFSERTVVFATLAPPDEILWLDSRDPSISGIDYIYLENQIDNEFELARNKIIERGLGLDIAGLHSEAQKFYRQALGLSYSDNVVRYLAISLAISGNMQDMKGALEPALIRGDRTAHRTFALALAIAGDIDAAVQVAQQSAPQEIADKIAPYLRFMHLLTKPQQVAAAHYGVYPKASDIGRPVGDLFSKQDSEYRTLYEGWLK